MRPGRIISIALGLFLSVAVASNSQAEKNITPEQARAIAKEASIYANPVVDSYRVIHGYFLDPEDPEFKAPLNTSPGSTHMKTKPSRHLIPTRLTAGWSLICDPSSLLAQGGGSGHHLDAAAAEAVAIIILQGELLLTSM